MVVDVSAILPLVFRDEDHAYSEAVVRNVATEGGHVPSLFWYEVWNALATNELRRGRISSKESENFVSLLQQMNLTVASLPASDKLLKLTREHHVTAYDAAYLELALRVNEPLATKDDELAGIAVVAGATVFLRN